MGDEEIYPYPLKDQDNYKPVTVHLDDIRFHYQNDIVARDLEKFLASSRVKLENLTLSSGKEWSLRVSLSTRDGAIFSSWAYRERTKEEIDKMELKQKELEEAQNRVNQLKSELAHYEK